MKMTFFRAATITATLLLAATQANAQLIWDNGSNTSNIGGYCSACGAMDEHTMFDNFSLADDLVSAVVDWDASFYDFTSANRSVRIGIWSDYNSGQLWSKVFSIDDLDVLSVNTQDGYNANMTVSALLDGVNLGAGNYWISFSGTDMHFEVNGSGNAGQVPLDLLGQRGFPQGLEALSFRLNTVPTPVPEPSTTMLLGLGLGFAG